MIAITNRELLSTVEAAYAEIEAEYRYVGVRFEDKAREVGKICENSRHNPNRDDERDFPEYGTPEYDDLDELDGTSVWEARQYIEALKHRCAWDGNNRARVLADHCYIVAGDNRGVHDDPDDGEILIRNAIVTKVIC